MMKYWSLLLVGLLAACASPQSNFDDKGALKLERKTDEFRKTFEILAPLQVTFADYKPDGHAYYRLRAGGPVGGKVQWMDISVQVEGDTWAFIGSAVDKEGRELKVTKVDKVVDRGTAEILSVGVSREYLHQATNGITIRLEGKRRNQMLYFGPRYVQGFLSECDK